MTRPCVRVGYPSVHAGHPAGAWMAGMALAAGVLAGAPAALGQAEDHVREYRSMDGRGNNRQHDSWGSAGVRYRRENSGAHYADGVSTPAGADRPSARVISNALAAQAEETENSRGLSTCWYEFGQFLDHDFGLALGGSSEAFNIQVPSGDPWFDPGSAGNRVIPMYRSDFDHGVAPGSARQQVNTVTAYIDASQVYGSDSARADWLRTHTGGRLKVLAAAYGDMLPYNDGTMSNDNPLGLPATDMYCAGDVRANEQVGLTSLHVVFLREHNWQADRLRALHPTWSDERLYQEARRWVAAEMQVVVYREWLPALLGHPLPPYTGYNPGVNPGLSNAFATAAYRIGHSMVGDDIDLLDEDFEEFGILELVEAFFNPHAIPEMDGINPVLRYFAASRQQETDTMIVNGLRNFLFGPPGSGGLDLASLNIQRGRDHGLADYNTMRADFGLPRVRRFSQITSDAARAAQLQSLYGNVDNIDPWVGLLAEDHVPGSSIGPTHAAIFLDQFRRLRDGDRFYYRNDGFSQSELATLEATTLADIFRRTTGITGLQDNLFFAVDHESACPADFDGNGTVEPSDVSAMVGAWLASVSGGTTDGDFDGNGVVQPADISLFVSTWFSALGTGC